MLARSKNYVFLLLAVFVLSTQGEAASFSALCQHAYSKLGEIPHNDLSRLNELVFRIDLALSNKKIKKASVKLSDLSSIHLITFPPAIAKTEKRAEVLRENSDRILTEKGLTSELMEELLPSKNSIRAIRDKHGKWVVFDGNGRIEAIRRAFSNNPDLLVEVELWEVENLGVLSILERVRKHNLGIR